MVHVHTYSAEPAQFFCWWDSNGDMNQSIHASVIEKTSHLIETETSGLFFLNNFQFTVCKEIYH